MFIGHSFLSSDCFHKGSIFVTLHLSTKNSSCWSKKFPRLTLQTFISNLAFDTRNANTWALFHHKLNALLPLLYSSQIRPPRSKNNIPHMSSIWRTGEFQCILGKNSKKYSNWRFISGFWNLNDLMEGSGWNCPDFRH